MSKTDTRKDVPKTETPADEDPKTRTEPEAEVEAEATDEADIEEEPKPKATSKKPAAEKRPEPDTDDEPDAEDEVDAEAGDEPRKVSAKSAAKVAGGPEKAGGAQRAWRGVPVRSWLVRATVAVAIVGSAVTAGLQWHAADQAAQRDQERQEVRASAAEFGVALLSYDHTKLQDARHRVLDLASDDFAKTYDEAFTGGLEGVISKLKADATAEVQSVYLEKIEEGTAKAVVVVDSEVHSTAGTRRVRGSYLDMKLVRRGGEWKVTDVTSVGAANESMVDPQGNQQTTPGDTAPAPQKSP